MKFSRIIYLPKNILFILIFLIFTSGCLTSRLSSDYDPDTDFSQYQTYRWLSEQDNKELSTNIENTLVDKRIKKATGGIMVKKGYEKDNTHPDFLIHYHVDVQTKGYISCRSHHLHSGFFSRNSHSHNGGLLRHRCYQREYQEANIILDIIDYKTGQLLWRGWNPVILHGPTMREKDVNIAVRKILDKFPPTAQYP